MKGLVALGGCLLLMGLGRESLGNSWGPRVALQGYSLVPA